MIGLIQRVREARVVVADETIGAIAAGLLVLVCAELGDEGGAPIKLVEKLLALRVFADGAGKMNRSLKDIAGGLLLVPQFTLAADLRGGNRPSFTRAAEPAIGRMMFDATVAAAHARHSPVETGRFGADMEVALVNDGPVTLWLRIDPPTSASA